MTGKSKSAKASRKPDGITVQFIYETLRDQMGPLDDLEIEDALDLAIFSHIALHLPLQDAVRAYQRFKTQFVDWNEVRISTAKDVQDILRSGDEPLELALFIKEFLNRLFVEQHQIGLEFLKDRSLSEIRSFFKPVPGLSESTVNLLLSRLKDYPVIPIESWMEPCLERLGLTNGSATTLQRQKDLFDRLTAPELVFPLHLYLLEHARQTCVLEDSKVDCPKCVLRSRCPSSASFRRRKASRAPKASTRKNGASRSATASKSSRTPRRRS